MRVSKLLGTLVLTLAVLCGAGALAREPVAEYRYSNIFNGEMSRGVITYFDHLGTYVIANDAGTDTKRVAVDKWGDRGVAVYVVERGHAYVMRFDDGPQFYWDPRVRHVPRGSVFYPMPQELSELPTPLGAYMIMYMGDTVDGNHIFTQMWQYPGVLIGCKTTIDGKGHFLTAICSDSRNNVITSQREAPP